jgi:hypothetical protein
LELRRVGLEIWRFGENGAGVGNRKWIMDFWILVRENNFLDKF